MRVFVAIVERMHIMDDTDFVIGTLGARAGVNLQYAVSIAAMPLYLSAHPPPPYRIDCQTIGTGVGEKRAKPLHYIEFRYLDAYYPDHTRVIRIINGHTPSSDDAFIHRWRVPAIMGWDLPKIYRPPFDWGDLKAIVKYPRNTMGASPDEVAEFIADTPLRSHTVATNLEFKFVHWDDPAPFTLAYSNTQEDKYIISVGGIGVPLSEFLNFLDTLVLLNDSKEELIANLQADLESSWKHDFPAEPLPDGFVQRSNDPLL